MTRMLGHLRRFWQLLGRFRGQAVIFVAITLATALLDGIGLSMIVPILDTILGEDVDRVLGLQLATVLGDIDTRTLLIGSAAVLAVTMTLKEVFLLWRSYFTTRFSMNLRNHWRWQLSESILLADEGALSEDRRGALLDLVINQTRKASKFVQIVLQMLTEAAFAAVMFGVMLSVSWWGTLVIVGVFALVIGATNVPVRRYASRLGRKALAVALRVSATVSESLVGLRELKVLSREQETLDDLGRLNAQQTRLRVRERVLTQLPNSVGSLIIALLVFVGVVFTALTPMAAVHEFLPAAALFVLVGQRLNRHVSGCVSKGVKMRTHYPALLLVTNTLDSLAPHVVRTGTRKFEHLEGDICLENVSFRYRGGAQVFDGLDLTFAHGAITAVFGPSGSGKSTIADLLLTLRRPQHGRIVVNGEDLNGYDVTSWRRRCAYVSQRPFLFNGSVLDNIRLGRPDASEDEIREAARRAHADEFIAKLENGYDTPVGEGGSKLSGGQAQRITIARALLRDPDLVVFDEPTSAVDAVARDYLRETFRSLAQNGKVVVIMTHDPTLIDDADITYEIRDKAVAPVRGGKGPLSPGPRTPGARARTRHARPA